MKTFNDFASATRWIKNILSDTNKIATESIAKQVYDDSKEFTYIDTEDMYDSGKSSDFAKGYVLIKAPQARWLYYTSGLTAHKNKKAVPQWFERTKIEHKKDYIKMYNNIFNKGKR